MSDDDAYSDDGFIQEDVDEDSDKEFIKNSKVKDDEYDEDDEDIVVNDEDADSEEEEELESKIAEEHEKFKLAQEERQEKSTIRTLPSPMPEAQRKREIEAQEFALAPPSTTDDRSDYLPPPREDSQTSYMNPPRPQSADRIRSNRLSSASRNLSDIQEDSPLDDAASKPDQEKKKEEDKVDTGVADLDDFVSHIQEVKQKARSAWGAIKRVSLDRGEEGRERILSRISSSGGNEPGDVSQRDATGSVGKWVVEGEDETPEETLPPAPSSLPPPPSPPSASEGAPPPAPASDPLPNGYCPDPMPPTPKKYSSLAESALGGPLPDLSLFLRPQTIVERAPDDESGLSLYSKKVQARPPPSSAPKSTSTRKRRPWSASPNLSSITERQQRPEDLAIDLLKKDIMTPLPPPSAPPPDISSGSKKPQRPSSARPFSARPSSAVPGSTRGGATGRPSSARPTYYQPQPPPAPYLQMSVDGKDPSNDWAINSPYYSPRMIYRAPAPSPAPRPRPRPQSATAAYSRPSRPHHPETVLRQISYDVPTSTAVSPADLGERRVAHGRKTVESPPPVEGSTAVLKLRGQNVSVYEVETLKRVQEANDSLAEIGRVDFFYQMWDANRIQLVRLDLKGREEVIKTITLAQLLSENAKLRQQRGERRGQSSGGGASPDVAPVQTETDEEVEQVSAPMSIQEEYRRKLAALSNNCAALADTTRRLRYSQVLW